MHDEQWCVKSLSKCENWLNKVIFSGHIVSKGSIFMDLKTLGLMLHEKGLQMLQRLKNLFVSSSY